MMRLAVGTALAWIILIFFLPFAGAAMYLVLGEKRLGRKRTQRAASLWGGYSRWLRQLPRQTPDEQSGLSPEALAVSRLPEGALGIPVLPGNRLEMMDAADPILRSIIADIDRRRSVTRKAHQPAPQTPSQIDVVRARATRRRAN